MEIVFIKLKNGTDIVSNTSIENNSLLLDNPMVVRQYSDQSGRITLSLNEWVPLDFVDTTQFSISKDETLLIVSTSLKIKEFYRECIRPAGPTLNEPEFDSEFSSDDAYTALAKLLSNNKKLMH